jgi:hypothetical protein
MDQVLCELDSGLEGVLLHIHKFLIIISVIIITRLIINDCLNTGTQIPYIKQALEEGYGVIVTNTNLNRDFKGLPIKVASSVNVVVYCIVY